MKKQILTLLVLLGSLNVGAQVFWSDNFEDAGSPSAGSRTMSVAEFKCSSGFFKRTDGSDITWSTAFTGYAGTKYFGAMDIDRGPGCGAQNTISPAQSITYSGINIAGKTGLSFKGLFGANSDGVFQGVFFNTASEGYVMDYMTIEYRVDGGAWKKILGIYPNSVTAAGGKMAIDTDNDMVGDGTILNNTLADLTGTISDTGTLLDLKFSIFLNNGIPGALAFDNFRLLSAPANTAPTASNVTNTGTLKEGQTLTGNYSYSDPESNSESGSTFKWYRSDNGSGLNKAAIASATGKNYVLVAADINKYISFEVTPRDGALNGTAVESPLRGPITPIVLPVGLLDFTAKIEGTGVRLDWRTASEINNKGFVVWHRGEGGDWKMLETVSGKGGIGSGALYNLVDRKPLLGNNYYRLVQVDIDGKENELETKSVSFTLTKSAIIVHPNPVVDKLKLSFEAGVYSDAKLLGPDGKLVRTLSLGTGTTSLEMDLNGMAKGIYLVGLKGKTGWVFEKVIKN